jgi:hypothetical protein
MQTLEMDRFYRKQHNNNIFDDQVNVKSISDVVIFGAVDVIG